MNTKPLEKFAQTARRQLHEQVRARLEQVLGTDSPELRARARLVTALNQEVANSSRDAVVERVAYTWFNRFCALRYMDANRYTRLGLVSPAPGHTQPELLQEAKAGHIDDELPVDKTRVFDLLSGRIPSPDGQAEAYRLLLIAACNYYHEPMPFLFAKIDDYSELLMPDDLLSQGSVLTAAREVLTEEVCQDVEVIGWLYQFYIAEKKDEVIGAKKKIKAADIPAATQLFTPDWIVRYLVQNSLGRLWLQNRPGSRLREQMEYFIDDDPVHPERSEGYLKVNSPEELTVLDPAVGSGHMLTYAFDLLYAIYEEEGYNPPDIPRLILARNLTGLEIDGRAAALAAFALMMKARARDRRFFRRGAEPHIIHLQPIRFSEAELDAEVEALLPLLAGEWQEQPRQMSLLATSQRQLPLTETQGLQELRAALRHDLNLFREADNYGSLLHPQLSADQLRHLASQLEPTTTTGQLQMFDQTRRKQVIQVVQQALALARYYDVVVANPPYLGNFNENLKKFAKNYFPDSKSDLFAMFMERNLALAMPKGYVAMINMQSWMFLSSYEKLRHKLLKHDTIVSMAHLGARAFDTIGGEVVSTTAFVLENETRPDYQGSYVRLVDGRSESEKAEALIAASQNPDCGYFFRATAEDFKKIPGSPIAYWVSNAVRNAFASYPGLLEFATPRQGLATSDNTRFVRQWSEVEVRRIGFGCKSAKQAQASGYVWFPFNKGGPFRRWYGNHDLVVNWHNDGEQIKESIVTKYPYLNGNPNFVAKNQKYYFKKGLTWSALSSGLFSLRIQLDGFIFADKGQAMFPYDLEHLLSLQALLNSKVASEFLKALSPTLDFNAGYIAKVPIIIVDTPNVSSLNSISKDDWDESESSWDFEESPLLDEKSGSETIASSYDRIRARWQSRTSQMQELEVANNDLIIECYSLNDELEPSVPLQLITLNCNPRYRYGGDRSEEELEALLLADTIREFISYAVGCMFGRYSLDKPGLILANQGETVADYLSAVSLQPSAVSFLPDEDNAIPMLDGEWFTDDITERFKRFLRVTFGEPHYEENLAFIEAALGRDIRGYFLREFYDHHLKMYKKRPIYWLFSSPRGSFNVLIYMHRYRPDTVSIILNDYLREFRAKLNARKDQLLGLSASAAASQREKTQALKEIDTLDKTLAEIRAYEDEILYPLATQQVQIDLDDGVLVNYRKFGKALKKVAGLS